MLAPTRTASRTNMAKREQLLSSLHDPEYRRQFADDIGTGIAFQIRRLRDTRGWTQQEVAHRTGKRQETISLCENPNYGKYSLSTLKELAGAFDVALMVKFAPFSELIDWTLNLTPERLAPASFDDEFAIRVTVPPLAADANATSFAVQQEPLRFPGSYTNQTLIKDAPRKENQYAEAV